MKGSAWNSMMWDSSTDCSIYRLTLRIVIPSSPLKMEMVCLSFIEKAYQKLFHHICYGLSLSFEEPLINKMYTILFKKKKRKWKWCWTSEKAKNNMFANLWLKTKVNSSSWILFVSNRHHMIEVLERSGIQQGTSLSIIKGVCIKSITNISLNRKKHKAVPLKLGTRQDFPLFP